MKTKRRNAGAINLPPIQVQREMARKIRESHIQSDKMLARAINAVKLAKAYRTAAIHKILGGASGAHERAWSRLRENPRYGIKDLISIKTANPKADFWVQRRGQTHQPMPFANNPGNPMNFYKPSPAVCRRNPLKFSDKRTREDFIEILVGLDPNGVWTDADNIAEGYEPLTREGALSAIRKIVSRDYE